MQMIVPLAISRNMKIQESQYTNKKHAVTTSVKTEAAGTGYYDITDNWQ